MEIGNLCGVVSRGRKAEDGTIPSTYPLTELPGGYRQRTQRNVQDSDGTLVISFGKPSGGTGKTLEFCERERKPYLLLDANQTSVERAAKLVAEFVS